VLTARYPELTGSLTIPRAYIVHSEPATAVAFELRRTLADTGWALDMDARQDGFGKQLARASRRGARMALILGEDEIVAGTCTIKDLASGSQSTVPLAAVPDCLASADRK
jgi:histidyl-tRNA synthetase